MIWNTPAELHAALNDLPAVLLLLALAFEIAGGITKRESLRATGFWMLTAGGGGALLALISGLRAEESIEHGGSVHLVMERHETLAITTTVIFVGLAAWRIWRRRAMPSRERAVFLGVGTLGVLFLLWTAHLGGTIVFRHGGGIPSSVMEGAMQERTTGHSHAPGEEHDVAPGDEARGAEGAEAAEEHTHAPDTPAHEHE
jgi:uncharacterized membrane protein